MKGHKMTKHLIFTLFLTAIAVYYYTGNSFGAILLGVIISIVTRNNQHHKRIVEYIAAFFLAMAIFDPNIQIKIDIIMNKLIAKLI